MRTANEQPAIVGSKDHPVHHYVITISFAVGTTLLPRQVDAISEFQPGCISEPEVAIEVTTQEGQRLIVRFRMQSHASTLSIKGKDGGDYAYLTGTRAKLLITKTFKSFPDDDYHIVEVTDD